MMNEVKRLRIAWFLEADAPLSLASYCSQLLLPLLSEQFEIELFSDSLTRRVAGLPSYHYLTAFRRHKESPFDLFFYQLEDGKQGRFSRMHLGLMPGVLWVHDLFLQDHGPEGLFTSPWERTLSQFRDPAIDFSDRSRAPHQLWPQAYREVSLAPVLLFSSQWAQQEFSHFISERLEPYPGGQRVEYLPVPVSHQDIRRPRGRSGVLQIANVGSVNTEDRAYKILPALRDVRHPAHLTWLIDASEESKARALLEEFSVADRVTLMIGRSIERWREVLAGCDVALYLHRSPFGHLSPYLHIALAAGTPLVVSDAAEGALLPKDLVFQVVPGMFESSELRELFDALSNHPLEALGARGREFVAAHNDMHLIATRLTAILKESAQGVRCCMERWEQLQQRAAQALFAEVLELAGVAPEGFEAQQFIAPLAQLLQDDCRSEDS